MRLIDADDLIKAFEALDLMKEEYAESFTNMAGNRSMEIEYAKGYIDNAKTIDSVPVVHAHWELAHEDTAYDNVWICSNCGEDFTQHRKPKFIYCPNCGAKMDEQVTKNEIKKQDIFL